MNDHLNRRHFLTTTTAAGLALCRGRFLPAAESKERETTEAELAFTAQGKECHFDTGVLRGTLRPQGRSLGLTSVVDTASGKAIARAYGLFSHYRLLDDRARYGHAAWDWASEARVLPGGAVEVRWSADDEHPFDMKAIYRWTAPNVLDVTTTVVARKGLKRFEVFLASYFEGFAKSLVYVAGCPETDGKPAFLEAKESYAKWQMFPRDDEAVEIIRDGRWRRPPSPVDWKIMPRLSAPLAMRRDAESGFAGLIMAPAADCFAVATPFGEESHRSLYLSLFGRDLKAGEAATARARLIIGRGISDDQAVALYKKYVEGEENHGN
ncbi:MAG: hypothetical protein ISR77_17695 [Pirellulaceae bacterium]|nr:hypothetical protein [Pirellulaceae bacterium]